MSDGNLTQKEQLFLAYGEGHLLAKRLNRAVVELQFVLDDLGKAIQIKDERAQKDVAAPLLAKLEEIASDVCA